MLGADFGIIVGIIICVMFSAFFSASETAFTTLNRIRLKTEAGRRLSGRTCTFHRREL